MIFVCPYCHTKVERSQSDCPVCHRVTIRRCPFCSEEISVLATVCKYCGEGVTPLPEKVAAKPAPPAATGVQTGPDIEFLDSVKYCAWEDPSKKGLFRPWWRTWWESQFLPAAFWEKMPAEGGHGKPISFAWFMTAQWLLLLVPVAWVILGAIGISVQASPWAYVVGACAGLALFPLSYVLCALGTYLFALIWHLPLKVLGAGGSFEGTLRVIAYSSGTAAWNLIPGVGAILEAVMLCVLHYHGFRVVHKLSKGRALLAALLPYLFVLALVAAAIVIPLVTHARRAAF